MQLKFTQEGNFWTCLRGVGDLNPFERLPLPYCTLPPNTTVSSSWGFLIHQTGIACLLLHANLCQVLGKQISDKNLTLKKQRVCCPFWEGLGPWEGLLG